MKHKIVKVKKYFQKIKFIDINDNWKPVLRKMKLCEKFPLGHKVYMQIGKHGIGTTLIDLTMMFGAGNEPTLTEFKTMFPEPYYEYN